MSQVELIEQFIKDFIVLVQVTQIYTVKHPKFEETLNRVFLQLEKILSTREDILLGIAEEELACEKEIFFELSKRNKQIIEYLKKRGIEKIIFRRGVRKEELINFFNYICFGIGEKKDKDFSSDLSFLGIKNISIGRIGFSVTDENFSSGDSKYFSIYEQFSTELNGCIEEIFNRDISLDFLKFKFLITQLFENFVVDFDRFFKLYIIKSHHQVTFSHLLNVAVLSMYFVAKKLGFSKEDTYNIGMAALFHDIGKLYISYKILDKQSRLSQEEITLLQSHTIEGSKLLLSYVDSIGILPVVVAFEHHLGYDCKGYPKLDFSYKPNFCSLIISICDTYEALLSKRSYKNFWPPERVYEFMIQKKGTFFEPELLEQFFCLLGVWPIGSVVLLSDKSVAIVRQENENDIFSPVVEVVEPVFKRGFVDLTKTKDFLKIERSLNLLDEAKKYVDLI